MEEKTKHTLSILDHSHSIFAHSIGILSDLSSVLVVNMCYSFELKSWLCVCIAMDLCVLLFPPLHPCFFVIIICKGERVQVVEIPRKRDIVKERRTPWYSS
jgi:hypothetical protein